MKVSYRKNLNKSYMCIETEDAPVETYELKMLAGCRIPELMKVWSSTANECSRYFYDISGKQQISDYLSGQKLGCSLLQKLLFAVQKVCANLPEYLLRESGICLELEFIYINLEDGGIQFTYLPFYEKSLPEAFRGCMEQLLRKIDHQDYQAVELGYQIYQLCVREHADIRNLLDKVMEKDVIEEGEIIWGWEQNGKAEEGSAEKEDREKQTPCLEPGQGHNKEKNEKRGNLKDLSAFWEKYFPSLAEKFAQCSEIWKKAGQASEKRKRVGLKDKKWLHKKEKSLKIEQSVTEGTLAESNQVVNPTEILAVREEGPVGKLEYRGIHQCKDIFIEGESFLLGKNEAQVDGVIPADGVSRLHARIIRQEQRYYIEDLNSTNGTYLNDVELEYHQPQELNRNDRIRFGAEEYVFS